MIGYLFFWALLGSMALVALNRAAAGLVFQCQSCGRNRLRTDRCGHCGIIDNPTPEKNSESTHA